MPKFKYIHIVLLALLLSMVGLNATTALAEDGQQKDGFVAVLYPDGTVHAVPKGTKLLDAVIPSEIRSKHELLGAAYDVPGIAQPMVTRKVWLHEGFGLFYRNFSDASVIYDRAANAFTIIKTSEVAMGESNWIFNGHFGFLSIIALLYLTVIRRNPIGPILALVVELVMVVGHFSVFHELATRIGFGVIAISLTSAFFLCKHKSNWKPKWELVAHWGTHIIFGCGVIFTGMAMYYSWP